MSCHRSNLCVPIKRTGDFIIEYNIDSPVYDVDRNYSVSLVTTSTTQKYPLQFANILVSNIVTTISDFYISLDITELPIKNRIVNAVIYVDSHPELYVFADYPFPYITSSGTLSSSLLIFDVSGPIQTTGTVMIIYC